MQDWATSHREGVQGWSRSDLEPIEKLGVLKAKVSGIDWKP